MRTHALFVPLLLLSRPGASAEVHFTDITEDAGITFVHENGATGKKYLPETMGSGVAFFDFDGDGDQDLLFVNSMSWPRGPTTSALYRNRGDGSFEDVTAGSGLDRAVYGMGVAVGDYDGDGDRDVYVTALGTNLLFRNDGGAKFTEVGKDAGVDHDGFGSSATWLDYDKDGDLDLFVLNYVQWSIEKDIFCALDGKNKSYCTPESYEGASAVLYRNDGEGKFTDVTKASGLENPRGKGLGAAVFDFDLDGWLDIAVANDTQPNYLYRNEGGGTFEDIGVLSGIAFAENGAARGAMGIDASDYDASGRQSLVIGNFSNEMLSLYHNEGRGFFIDQAPVSEIGRASLVTLSFASFFFDYDLDGREDIFVANGHVESDIHNVQQRVSDPIEVRGQVDLHFAHELRGITENRRDDRRRVVSLEGAFPGEQLIVDDTEREDVRAVVDRLPLSLLGRHVRHRADDHSVLRQCLGGDRRQLGSPFLLLQLRQAEVEDLDLALFGDHDVARLDVAVRDAFLVRRTQRIGERSGDLEESIQ